MKTAIVALAATVAAGTAMPACAQHVTAALSGGTLGIGPEIGYRVNDTFGARGSATFFGVSHEIDSDDVTYSGKVRLRSYGAMLDLYPFGGKFHLSAGARINRNHIRATATPTAPTEIGDRTYTPAQIGTLRTRAEVKKFAPALTLGWLGGNARGFYFGSDLGVLFQGRIRIRPITATGALASQAAFLSDLEVERRDVQDDVDDYKIYPILQASIGWRF